MGTPKGWPLGLAPEIAERYRNPIEALNSDRSWRQERNEDMFIMAMEVGIGECERARRYSWPDEDETDKQETEAAQWDRVSLLAGKLAKELKFARRLSVTDRGIAAAYSGLGLIVARENGQWLPYYDIEAGLECKRWDTNPESCSSSWALYQVLNRMAHLNSPPTKRYRFGALKVKEGMENKGPRPSRATFLSICLMHKFRLLGAWKPGSGNFVTYNGTDLERTQGTPKATIAAFFAAAAFDDEATAVQERAKAWLRDTKDRTIYYWGWSEKGTKPPRKK